MKLTPFCAALALITTLSSFAEIEAPSIEASINYKSMKIERGMVENKESVFGYEVELGWYGIVGGIETCHDMTNIDGRRGRYNEIESFLGYEHSFGDFSARIAYIYKRCILEEPDTQEVELELEIELCEHLKLVPSVDLYDQFTSAARHEYEKGFAAVGGCHLVAEF